LKVRGGCPSEGYLDREAACAALVTFRAEPASPSGPTRHVRSRTLSIGAVMIEVILEDSDRLDWALKAFKKKMLRSGILKDLRRKRHYVKPSEARQLKAAEARRRKRSGK
jgi:small subunit ribosomal protein S21